MCSHPSSWRHLIITPILRRPEHEVRKFDVSKARGQAGVRHVRAVHRVQEGSKTRRQFLGLVDHGAHRVHEEMEYGYLRAVVLDNAWKELDKLGFSCRKNDCVLGARKGRPVVRQARVLDRVIPEGCRRTVSRCISCTGGRIKRTTRLHVAPVSPQLAYATGLRQRELGCGAKNQQEGRVSAHATTHLRRPVSSGLRTTPSSLYAQCGCGCAPRLPACVR
jgi:hypothetical protein